MTPQEIFEQMYSKDRFSKLLDIELVEIAEGKCVLQMIITSDMLNGFDIAHGGITYSLADSALAFASNSYGRKAVSIETSISHTKPCKAGDVITATATPVSVTSKIGIFNVEIKNQKDELVATFKGTVYRTSSEY